ncbi:hypothetical protein OSB04_008152 [Centaurea solstitialis]|uniref:MULE transposase domain-containing protein n=1 Tax=Centaurea solstitialis TaxID=347529 RepID=A0AA38U4H8_9ASTR|nr:hypothetical protein OSB04_008152 [Centaurea solstitialis]
MQPPPPPSPKPKSKPITTTAPEFWDGFDGFEKKEGFDEFEEKEKIKGLRKGITNHYTIVWTRGSRASRQLQCTKFRNIGAAKSYPIQAALKGGYEYVGPMSVDYQTILEGTFLGVDNHKSSVVVDCSRISHKNITNFKWVINAFIKAYGKRSLFLVTNQGAAMKQVLPEVFTNSKHRLCMWHFMKKLLNKFFLFLLLLKHLSGDPEENLLIKKRFNKLVWNMHISPEEFERGWIDSDGYGGI